MTIEYRNGSTAGNSSQANCTIDKPLNTADGDILIAVCYNEISATAWTPPSGWAEWGSGQVCKSDFAWVNVYWKRASSEGSSYTFTIATTWRIIAMAAFSGALASGDPLDVGPTGNKAATSEITPIALSITTTENNTMRVAGHGNYSGDNVAGAGTSSMTQGPFLGGCEGWYAVQASSGASGNKSFADFPSGHVYWITDHLAIKIAGGVIPSPNVSDSSTLSENIGAVVSTSAIIVSDTVGNSESVTSRIVIAIDVFDTAGVTESVGAIVGTPQINKSETIGNSELVQAAILFQINVSDAVGTSENSVTQVVDRVTVSDNVGISENSTANIVISVSVSETVGTTESSNATVSTSIINVSDLIGVAESSNADISYTVNVTDSIGTSEAVGGTVETASINVSDAVGASENTVIVLGGGVAVSDVVGTAETVTGFIGISLNVSDGISVSEANGVSASTHMIYVGNGYNDGTPQQLIRTRDNRIWAASWKFDTYNYGPPTGLGQTLRMYKADQVGTPSTFTRMDSANEPSNPTTWAIAVDNNDLIHVIWMERASWEGPNFGTLQNLKYCTFSTSGGTWGTPVTIDNALGITNDFGQGDETAALAIDSNGIPHVVYCKYDGTRRRVTYRNKIGGSWSSPETVDDQSFGAGQFIHHPGIAFDNAGRIVVTWIRGGIELQTDGRLFIRVYDGSWGTTHDVVGADIWPGIDVCTRLYVAPGGRYHICYINTSKNVQYRYSDDQGATWTANSPSSGTYTADNPIAAPGPNGVVRIYSHSTGTPYNIVYWESTNGSGAWTGPTAYMNSPDGFDCTVNVRWNRYWWYHPSTFDIMYWKSTYSPSTNELYIGTDFSNSDTWTIESISISDLATVQLGEGPAALSISITADTVFAPGIKILDPV